MIDNTPQQTGSTADDADKTQSAADRLGPLKARVRAALDCVSESTRALPRMDPMFSRRRRKELVRLMEAGQARDAFDQRMTHVEAALDRIDALPDVGRAAVDTVVARQLMEISVMLEETAKSVAVSFRAINDALIEQDGVQGATDELITLGRRGFEAAKDLAAAAEVLGAEAAGHAERIDGRIPAEAVREADLDWLFALYTMEEERSAHRLAIAQFGLVA